MDNISSSKDLLAKAQEYSSADVDLYDLLQIDAGQTEDKEIRRAWRKQSLKYHPDKLKDAFDPAKWELFETARDILLDAAARAAYDGARRAALLRRAERDRVQGHRKRLIDELEAAELEAKRRRLDEEDRRRELEREKARLAEEGRRRMAEEAERFKRENLDRLEMGRDRDREPDEFDERLAELQRQLDENRRRKADKAERKAQKRALKKGGGGGGNEAVGTEAAAGGGTKTAGDAASGTSATRKPDSEPGPRPPIVWEDLKARMLEAQRRKDARKAAEAAAATGVTENASTA